MLFEKKNLGVDQEIFIEMEPVSLPLNVQKKEARHQAPVLEGKLFANKIAVDHFINVYDCLFIHELNFSLSSHIKCPHSIVLKKLSVPFYSLSFGVCCVFMTSTCGASVSQNCSYIKNPGYPSAFTSTSSCSYSINKCDPCKFFLISRIYVQT